MNRQEMLNDKLKEEILDPTNLIDEKNKLTLSDINALVECVPNLRGKAYVTMILSSGMARPQVLSLKIDDLVKSCFHLINGPIPKDKDILTFLLSLNPQKIIPKWRIDTSNGKKITFSSSESSYYLFLYLKHRHLKNPISLDQPLFGVGGKVLSRKQINDIFKYFDEVKLMGSKSDALTCSDAILRNYFISACVQCLPSLIDNKKDLERIVLNKKNNTKRNKLCKLFIDGLKEDDKYYQEFISDERQLEKYYSCIEPYLTTKNHLNENIDIPMEPIESRLYYSYAFKEKYTPKELDEIIDNYLTKFSSYPNFDEDDQKVIKYLKAYVKEENEYNAFSFTESHLDDLLVDCIMEREIDSDNFFNKVNISKRSPRYTINQIINHLDDLDIFKKFFISKELFEEYLIFYFKVLKEPDETYLTKKDIAKKLLDIKYDVFPDYFIEKGQYNPD